MEDHPRVVLCLERARDFGFFGPGPIADHVHHALGFAEILSQREISPSRVVDLGSGGGLPGLVLLPLFGQSQWLFVDGNRRRMDFLFDCLEGLGEDDRCAVVCERAELVGRDARFRGTIDVAVARGFASPAVTAECAAPFLVPGGWMVVSEPPVDSGRWPAEGLALLGLVGERTLARGRSFFRAVATEGCSDTYPRRVGVPVKRPLF